MFVANYEQSKETVVCKLPSVSSNLKMVRYKVMRHYKLKLFSHVLVFFQTLFFQALGYVKTNYIFQA